MTFISPRLPLVHAAFYLLLPLAGGCANGPKAESPTEAQPSEHAGSEPAPEPDETTSSPELVAGETCAETGCFSCGEGTCPKGSYCDETKPEKSACSWLSDCGDVPSCACLTRVLGASCSCEESQGSARVRCAE